MKYATLTLLLLHVLIPIIASEAQCGPLDVIDNAEVDVDADTNAVVTEVIQDITEDDCIKTCCDIADEDNCDVVVYEAASSLCALLVCNPPEQCVTVESAGHAVTFVGRVNDTSTEISLSKASTTTTTTTTSPLIANEQTPLTTTTEANGSYVSSAQSTMTEKITETPQKPENTSTSIKTTTTRAVEHSENINQTITPLHEGESDKSVVTNSIETTMQSPLSSDNETATTTTPMTNSASSGYSTSSTTLAATTTASSKTQSNASHSQSSNDTEILTTTVGISTVTTSSVDNATALNNMEKTQETKGTTDIETPFTPNLQTTTLSESSETKSQSNNFNTTTNTTTTTTTITTTTATSTKSSEEQFALITTIPPTNIGEETSETPERDGAIVNNQSLPEEQPSSGRTTPSFVSTAVETSSGSTSQSSFSSSSSTSEDSSTASVASTIPVNASIPSNSTASKSGSLPAPDNGFEPLSAGLIAALSLGVICFFAVMVLLGKRLFNSWQRRHYNRMDYLINGMYN